MNPTRQALHVATLLLSILFAAGGRAATVDRLLPDPRMLGEWVLDADHSDDAVKLLQPPHDAPRGPPPGDATASGPPPNGPPGSDAGDPGGRRGFTGVPALDQELTRGRSLVLRIDADRITLVYPGERQRTLHDANRGDRVVSASRGSEDGEFGYSIAYADGTTLVIETPGGRSGATFERYTLGQDGTTLQVTLTRLPQGDRPVAAVRRQFVRPRGAMPPSGVEGSGLASQDDER